MICTILVWAFIAYLWATYAMRIYRHGLKAVLAEDAAERVKLKKEASQRQRNRDRGWREWYARRRQMGGR